MGLGTAPRCTVVWTSGSTPARINETLDGAGLLLPELSVTQDENWVPHTAIAITTALRERRTAPSPPLLLVCSGQYACFAPHLGFAQRAARRSVAGYVLINPELPPPGAVSDWPDAPVHVVITPDAPVAILDIERAAHLRGWTVHSADVATALTGIVANL